MPRKNLSFGAAAWVLMAALAPACGPPTDPVTPPSAGSEPEAPAKPSARDGLLEVLRTVERGDPPLAAFAEKQRKTLDRLVQNLSEGDKELLISRGAKARPVSHLLVGGSSPDALIAIARGSLDELTGLLAARVLLDPPTWVEPIAEMKKRAAKHFLRESAIAVGADDGPSLALLDDIDLAGLVLYRDDIVRAARALGVEIEPTPDRMLAAADAAAWDLDVAAARAWEARVAADAEVSPDRRAKTQRNIRAAEIAIAAQKVKELPLEEAIGVGRALLYLGRPNDALAALKPHASLAPTHLAVATSLGRAQTGGTVCPRLMGRAPPSLCGLAWRSDPAVAEALKVMERAWASGKGRDPEAAERYLGLRHVVPSMYGLMRGPAGGSGRDVIRQWLDGFGKASREASGLAPSLAGLSLCVDALAGLLRFSMAPPSEQPKIRAELKETIGARARELGKKDPNDRMVQAGVLAAGALGSRSGDVGPYLALLPKTVAPGNRVSRASLSMLEAVGNEDRQLADEASAELMSAIAEQNPSDERSRVVLLMAEATAALEPKPRSWDVLSQVGSQLAEGASLELRLRGAIDAAGARARGGDRAGAEKGLEKLVVALGSDPSAAHEPLFALAQSYLVVLRAEGTKGAELVEWRKKLVGLVAKNDRLPDSIALWRELWIAELDYRHAVGRCGLAKHCTVASEKARTDAHSRIDSGLGTAAAKIARRGTLTTAGAQLSFRYSDLTGLEPVVSFDPAFLAIELPKLNDEKK